MGARARLISLHGIHLAYYEDKPVDYPNMVRTYTGAIHHNYLETNQIRDLLEKASEYVDYYHQCIHGTRQVYH